MKLQIILLLIIFSSIFETIQRNNVTRSEIILKKESQSSKWSERVIRKMHKDPKIYQIMLITNNKNDHDLEIIQNLQEHLPILYFNDSYLRREIQEIEKRKSLNSPRDTTLFFIVESPDLTNTQRTEEVMELIKKLSTVRIRPKCLIVRFFDANQTSNYAKFLQKMWKDSFLDVTILDVIKGRATMHQLNPFVSYKIKPYIKRTKLFPNKLRNLNGYPVKVGVLNRPPYINLKRNSTNHPYDLTGPDAEVGKIFAKLLNYSQVFLPSNQEDGGIFTCNENDFTGFFKELYQNKMQVFTITGSAPKSFCKKEIFEGTIFSVDHYVAIAPIMMRSRNYSIVIGGTFFYSILLTLSMAIITWIIVKLFKFDDTVWKWTLVIQILFGVSANVQLKELKERIIFGCLLIIHFYYSYNILISLTDFNFRLDEEREINTLNDLMNSGLQFSSELNKILGFTKVINLTEFTSWVRNGRVTTYEECIELLLEYRNITCIMRSSQAEWYAGFFREQNLVKVVPEFITSVGIGFILEPGSPFVERFQQIHRSVTEFALLEKMKIKKMLNTTRYYQLITESEENDDDEWKLISLLIGILIAGYVASIISFVAELFYDKWKQRQKFQ